MIVRNTIRAALADNQHRAHRPYKGKSYHPQPTTQAALALAVGVDRRVIQRLCARPDIDSPVSLVLRIAAVMGRPVEEMYQLQA